MKFKNLYRSYLDNLITVAKIMVNNQDTQKAFNLISSYINTDKKIFICGNGGSAHTANHFVTDWVKMLNVKKKKKSMFLASIVKLALLQLMQMIWLTIKFSQNN